MQVVLASSSPSRKRQLLDLGLEFIAVSPDFDEEDFQAQNPASPSELVVQMGFEKAKSLQSKFPNAVLIGSDQMMVQNGQIFGKGHTFANTLANLKKLSGKTHQVLTSLAVITPTKTFRHLETVEITFRQLDENQLQNYVRVDDPLKCAGGYKIEKAGIALMEKIIAQDPSAIQGLPLMKLTSIFLQLGLGLPFEKRPL